MYSSFFSIIIVNWNGCELLKKCLHSITSTISTENCEILVVDNASTDDSVQMVEQEFSQVKLIQNNKNVGFAKANNIGIENSTGEIILLLNSDTELKSTNILRQAQDLFSQNKNIGIAGVNLIFPNGVPQAPGGKFISNWQLFKYQVLFMSSPVFYKLKSKLPIYSQESHYDIDYVSGACLFVRKDVINDVGLLNDEFFMYGEDMEFCYRAMEKGWRRVILPSIEVVHLKGQSTKKNVEQVLSNSIKNNCYLINKFYGKKNAILAHIIYSMGLFLRLLLSLIRKDIHPRSYWKLIIANARLSFSY